VMAVKGKRTYRYVEEDVRISGCRGRGNGRLGGILIGTIVSAIDAIPGKRVRQLTSTNEANPILAEMHQCTETSSACDPSSAGFQVL
jgi:hypothetical protein